MERLGMDALHDTCCFSYRYFCGSIAAISFGGGALGLGWDLLRPPEKFVQADAERIPSFTLHLVDKGAHFVMFEKADGVNEVMKGFMK